MSKSPSNWITELLAIIKQSIILCLLLQAAAPSATSCWTDEPQLISAAGEPLQWQPLGHADPPGEYQNTNRFSHWTDQYVTAVKTTAFREGQSYEVRARLPKWHTSRTWSGKGYFAQISESIQINITWSIFFPLRRLRISCHWAPQAYCQFLGSKTAHSTQWVPNGR